MAFQAVEDSTQISNVPVVVYFQTRFGKTALPVVVNRDPRVSSVDFVQIGNRSVCATPPTSGCFDHSIFAGGDTFDLTEGVAPDTSVARAATSYTLRLSDRPAPGATVRVTPRQAEMSGGGDLRFFPSVAAWNHDNWQEERSIHVMSAHDGDVENAVFRIEHQFNEHFSGDTAAGNSLVIHGTVADDDEVSLVIKNSAGVTVPPNDAAADLVLRRGAETSYTVELSHSPPSPVTAWVRTFDSDKTKKSPVGVSAGGSFTEDIWVGLPIDAVNARQTGFTFDSTNWDSPRTVYVKRWWYTEDYPCINGHDGSGGYCWEIEHHLDSGVPGFVDSTAQTLRVSMPDATTNIVSPDLIEHVRMHATDQAVWRRIRKAIGDGFDSYAPMTSVEAQAIMETQTARIERRIDEDPPSWRVAQLEEEIGEITQKWWPIVKALEELERTGVIPSYEPNPIGQWSVPQSDTQQPDSVVPQSDTQQPDSVVQQQSDPVVQQQSDPVVQQQSDPVVQQQSDPVVQQLSDPVAVVCPSDDAPGYSDVPESSFAYDDSRCLRELGISDTGDTYRPSDYMTRSEMAAFMSNAYTALTGTEAPVVDHGFTDIGNDPNADDIARIYGLMITTGTSPTTYAPDDHVIRAQMALFLTRLYKAVTRSEAPAGDTPFTDLADRSAQEQAAIGQLYALGVTRGTSQTTFDPSARVTREQMASFVARIYHVLAQRS